MANAMPQALGCQPPPRSVRWWRCADGGSQHAGWAISVGGDEVSKKIVVLNNSVLGFVAMEMKAGAI